jgi:alkylhydroperoxidase/carboxymuconolactone decarboxylase family protein YurZ
MCSSDVYGLSKEDSEELIHVMVMQAGKAEGAPGGQGQEEQKLKQREEEQKTAAQAISQAVVDKDVQKMKVAIAKAEEVGVAREEINTALAVLNQEEEREAEIEKLKQANPKMGKLLEEQVAATRENARQQAAKEQLQVD